MNKKLTKNELYLEAEEEQEILHALEKGTLKRSKTYKKDIAFAEEAAKNFFKKDARLNIRISSNDLSHLKRRAAIKGLPYQTFIAGILHEIAAGHFGGDAQVT